MFFKNAKLYICKLQLDLDSLQDQLLKNKFKPAGKREPSSMGWEAPLGESHELLYHAANNCVMLCARMEERLLPAKVIRKTVLDKVAEIEARENRKVYRKEQQSIKDEVIHDLLPQAFSSSKYTFGYLDMNNGYLAVDASSYAAAEKFICLLRESLGSLPLSLIQTAHSPSMVMSQWLRSENVPSNFVLGDEVQLAEFGEAGKRITCRHVDLLSEEIAIHLDHGAQVQQLRINWEEDIELSIDDTLGLKRFRFSSKLICEAEEAGTEDVAARFDADFSIMADALGRFTNQMIDWFGGLRQMELDL